MTNTDLSAPGGFGQLDLTERQRAVLDLLADGLTSKEIAARLDRTESSVNHSIDGIRARVGNVSRAVLARNYREWRKEINEREKIPVVGERIPVVSPASGNERTERDDQPGVFRFEDAVILTTDTPWTGRIEPQVVPRLLDGPKGGLFRVLTIACMLLAILVILVLGLTAAQVLTDTLGEGRPVQASQ